jgi:hypothetical protein
VPTAWRCRKSLLSRVYWVAVPEAWRARRLNRPLQKLTPRAKGHAHLQRPLKRKDWPFEQLPGPPLPGVGTSARAAVTATATSQAAAAAVRPHPPRGAGRGE